MLDMTEDIRRHLDLPDLDQVGFVVRNMEQALALLFHGHRMGNLSQCVIGLAASYKFLP